MIYINPNSFESPVTKYVMKNSNHIIIDDATVINDDKRNIVLASAPDEFVHACPGTKIYRCCNYHNLDIMQGCPFDCSYCILQAYLPHKMIKVATDIDMIKGQIVAAAVQNKIRLGSGELSDSLAIDHIVPLSKFLIPIANNLDNLQFEFKTKSANIKNLLELNPKNILVSWSLNPQVIIDADEHNTASLDKRLEAAKTLSECGYKIAFHFDPLIMVDGFRGYYDELFDKLFSMIDERSVEFISISSFRAPKELIEAMLLRGELPRFLHHDFTKGLDGKLRYFKSLRIAILRYIHERISREWKRVFIYFCMEHDTVWNDIIGIDPGQRAEFEMLFPHS